MFRYFIIYKPYLVLSQFSPVDGKKTLTDFFQLPNDVYPVGRLDYDSEGLLILTNDTRLNYKLLHPTQLHEREYYVQLDGAITIDALQKLQAGVEISIDEKKHTTQPARATAFSVDPILPDRDPPIRFRKNIPTSWISLTLTEGKNRQVRKMTAAVGFPTLRLVRYRIKKIELLSMQPGDIIELSEASIHKQLFKSK